MYRQYVRVLKLPTSLITLENNQGLLFKGIKRHLVYQRYSNLNHRHTYFQIGPEVFNLSRSIILSHNQDVRYFSKQNSKAETITGEKSDNPCTVNIGIPSRTDFNTQENQSSGSGDQLIKEFDLFEDVNYDEITDKNEEKLNQFKLLMLEIDVLRQDGLNVPSKLSTEQWKELFALQSRGQRRKYLTFLWKTEMKRLNDKRKKELKRLARLEEPDNKDVDSDQLQYGFRGSTIHVRVYDSTINFYDNCRLIRAMMFGQDLVIDCGFYNDMNTMENKLCCKQLVYAFAENRLAKEPFDLHFCNLKKDSILYHQMKKAIPTMEDPDFPINLYEEHYLDLFPKEKLVYLTPDCRTELKEFNHDDIYIIGAIVDRVNTQPLTLAKAKSEGLRMAKLPLDRYLDWAMGNKSLTINQMVMIMHDANVTGDWVTALKNVPQRKIRHPDQPLKDPRKLKNRGTTFQPPQRFIKYY